MDFGEGFVKKQPFYHFLDLAGIKQHSEITNHLFLRCVLTLPRSTNYSKILTLSLSVRPAYSSLQRCGCWEARGSSCCGTPGLTYPRLRLGSGR